MITIDEFRKLELRVATIRKAEPRPNAEKLLVLHIELGSEEHQIVAGIKGHYTPAELVGKQFVVVANLESARLRGIESQGMLLAASGNLKSGVNTAFGFLNFTTLIKLNDASIDSEPEETLTR